MLRANLKCSRFDRGIRVHSKLLNARTFASELGLLRLNPLSISGGSRKSAYFLFMNNRL